MPPDLRHLILDRGFELAEILIRSAGIKGGRRSGRHHWRVQSPVRPDNNPSFEILIEADGGTPAGSWIDRTTNESGDVFDLVARVNNFDVHSDFPKVLEVAARALGIALDDKSTPAVGKSRPQAPSHLTAEALAAHYGLTVEDFTAAGFGFTHWPGQPGRPAVAYPVTLLSGRPLTKYKSFDRPQKGKRDSMVAPSGMQELGLIGADALDRCKSQPVVLAGGEEKMLAARKAGFHAIAPQAGEKALPSECNEWIARSNPSTVIVAYDADKQGLEGTLAAARELKAAGVAEVRAVQWADDTERGTDLNNILADAGLQAVRDLLNSAQLVGAEPSVAAERTAKPNMPVIVSAAALQRKKFAKPREIIRGIRPEGLTVLAARPKKGKSWLELSNAINVASGQPALGAFAVEFGSVLYLALEDSEPRMQSRLKVLQAEGTEAPERLYFAYSWPRLDRGGLEALRGWLSKDESPAMIVVDTFTRIRPVKDARGDSYQQDADATAQLQSLALEFHVSIVLILHQRKGAADDIFDTISGTLGMTASADVVSVLVRDPKSVQGRLMVTGRDIEERELALIFAAGKWSFAGDIDEDEPQGPLDAAIAFLRECLQSGPVDSKVIFKEGKARGIGKDTLYAAKDRLRIRPKKLGFTGGWIWSLPSLRCLSSEMFDASTPSSLTDPSSQKLAEVREFTQDGELPEDRQDPEDCQAGAEIRPGDEVVRWTA